jgi:hypothetical protein
MEFEDAGTVWDFAEDQGLDTDDDNYWNEISRLNSILRDFIFSLPNDNILTYNEYH